MKFLLGVLVTLTILNINKVKELDEKLGKHIKVTKLEIQLQSDLNKQFRAQLQKRS